MEDIREKKKALQELQDESPQSPTTQEGSSQMADDDACAATGARPKEASPPPHQGEFLDLEKVQEPFCKNAEKPMAEVLPRWGGRDPTPGVLNLPQTYPKDRSHIELEEFDLVNNTNGTLQFVGEENGLTAIRTYLDDSRAAQDSSGDDQ